MHEINRRCLTLHARPRKIRIEKGTETIPEPPSKFRMIDSTPLLDCITNISSNTGTIFSRKKKFDYNWFQIRTHQTLHAAPSCDQQFFELIRMQYLSSTLLISHTISAWIVHINFQLFDKVRICLRCLPKWQELHQQWKNGDRESGKDFIVWLQFINKQ